MPAPVSQNATPTGDTRYNVVGHATQIAPKTWKDDAGFIYYGDDPTSILAQNRPNTLDPNLTDWRNGGGGAGGGGGSALMSNPYYQQAAAASQAADAADLSGTKSQLQQLLIQFGLVPEGWQDKLGVLDDTIRALIAKNTETGISQWARLLEGEKDIMRQTVAEASASGRRRSGGYGFRLRRNSLNNQRTRSDSLTALLSALSGGESGYAQRAFGRQMNLAQLLASLSSSWNPPGGGSPGGGAPVTTAAAASPSTSTPTIGNSTNYYGPAAGTPGGGFTSPKKPLLMP